MKRIITISLLCLSFFALTLNCKKDKILSSAIYNISTSQDTILFDTLFTTIGSTTKYFKCYNQNNGIINISNISLENGTNSPFRINVDGQSGVNFQNIQLLPGDSLFVFVEVTIDPNGNNLPLVVEDKIIFNTNGNQNQVILNAWGQDAYFHVNEIVSGIWSNDKPHVIYGVAAVGYPSSDSNLTLQIDPGTKIHGHANALLYVYKSSLQVNGTVNDPVVFSQDRTEDYLLYSADSSAGQWRGIYFTAAKNSFINHAEIKNAVIGIQADTLTSNNIISLDKVKINNSLYSNILTQGANVNATNCLFGNSSNYSAFISIGGSVTFEHCTFSNYWPGIRNSPSFIFKNYYLSTNDDIIYRPFFQADFINCIMDGNAETEFVCDTIGSDIGFSVSAAFHYCSIKTEDTLNNQEVFNNCFRNLNINFKDVDRWDFELTDSSEVIDLGTTSLLSIDLLDRFRTIPNDLGCYEFQ